MTHFSETYLRLLDVRLIARNGYERWLCYEVKVCVITKCQNCAANIMYVLFVIKMNIVQRSDGV